MTTDFSRRSHIKALSRPLPSEPQRRLRPHVVEIAARRAVVECLEGRMMMSVAPTSAATPGVGLPSDTTPPTAMVSTPNTGTSAGEDMVFFGVTYSDDIGVDTATINDNDVFVTAPDGAEYPVGLVFFNDNGDNTVSVNYSFSIAAGFSPVNAGNYTVTVIPYNGQTDAGVADTSGNGVVAGVIGTFHLDVTGQTEDTHAPAAGVEVPSPVGVIGAPAYTFTVTYSDDVALDTNTLNDNDIQVSGPNGFSAIAHYAGPANLPDGTFVRAQYQIPAPSGGFTAASAGSYLVTMLAYDPQTEMVGVADTSGNQVPAGPIGTFNLQFGSPMASNLSLTNVTTPTGRYAPGSRIAFQATIINNGSISSGPFHVDLTLSPNALIGDTDDIDLGNLPISQPLPPGASVTVKLTSNALPAVAVPGNYYYAATLRADGANGGEQQSNQVFASTSAVITIAPPPPPPAPPPIGGLDTAFGNGGIVRQQIGLADTNAVAIQADGKTVAVGDAVGPGGYDFGVTRFNTDGSLDSTFGMGGVFFTDFAGNNDSPIGVVIQPDGKILVAGTTTIVGGPANGNSDFTLARYNPDGTPDASFGDNGRVHTDFANGSIDLARDLALMPDGRILVAGSAAVAGGADDFAIARYQSNGAPDASFGGGRGVVMTDFAGGADEANAIAYDPQKGQLIVAGSSTNPSTNITSFAVARYNPDGALDAGFGAGGKVVTSIGVKDDEAFAVALGTKGQIIVTGGTQVIGGSVTSSNFAIARYTVKGVLDRTFGNNGIVTTAVGQAAVANQVQVNDDGSLLVAGAAAASLDTVDPSHLNVALVEYNPSGSLATAFGSNGISLLTLGTSTTAAPAGVTVVVGDYNRQVLAVLSKQRAIARSLADQQLVVVATNGDTTVAAKIVASGADLTGSIATTLPSAIVAGAKGSAIVTVTDDGDQKVSGAVTITLYASLDSSIDSNDTALMSVSGKKIKLNASASKAFKTKFVVPQSLAGGDYYIISMIDSSGTISELSSDNNAPTTAAAISVETPSADLTGSTLTVPTGLSPGSSARLPITITNNGNVTATGSVAIQVVAAADTTPAAGDTTLADAEHLKLKIKPGASKTFKVKAQIPTTLAAGNYYLLATLQSSGGPTDPNEGNNLLAGADSLVIG